MKNRWHRIRGGWRCALRIHRWKGRHDHGDGVNVSPISGYRKPHGPNYFRVCDWCGEFQEAQRLGDDRVRFFVWGAKRKPNSRAHSSVG